MQQETDLFDPRRLARTTDPSTSHAAAKSMAGAIGPQHQEVLSVLERGYSLAAEQIEDILGHSIWRRMGELAEKGLIERTDEQHKNRSGRMAYKYKIVIC